MRPLTPSAGPVAGVLTGVSRGPAPASVWVGGRGEGGCRAVGEEVSWAPAHQAAGTGATCEPVHP
jgi:hypothetical protein